MIEIKEYEEKYAEEISNIVTRNLLEVNVKDYGLEFSKKHAEEFTIDKIKENFKNRTKTCQRGRGILALFLIKITNNLCNSFLYFLNPLQIFCV